MAGTILDGDELSFVSRIRVARLATASAEGEPHVVPIVFATDGNRVFTPLDEKPKRVALTKLKRVRNILANPKVSIIVDEYSEDWSRLAWVLLTGTAEIVYSGDLHSAGAGLLKARYPQYDQMSFEGRPLIVITIKRMTTWKGARR
jgi:PPOX class probable F420-dependent enzyme